MSIKQASTLTNLYDNLFVCRLEDTSIPCRHRQPVLAWVGFSRDDGIQKAWLMSDGVTDRGTVVRMLPVRDKPYELCLKRWDITVDREVMPGPRGRKFATAMDMVEAVAGEAPDVLINHGAKQFSGYSVFGLQPPPTHVGLQHVAWIETRAGRRELKKNSMGAYFIRDLVSNRQVEILPEDLCFFIENGPCACINNRCSR